MINVDFLFGYSLWEGLCPFFFFFFLFFSLFFSYFFFFFSPLTSLKLLSPYFFPLTFFPIFFFFYPSLADPSPCIVLWISVITLRIGSADGVFVLSLGDCGCDGGGGGRMIRCNALNFLCAVVGLSVCRC